VQKYHTYLWAVSPEFHYQRNNKLSDIPVGQTVLLLTLSHSPYALFYDILRSRLPMLGCFLFTTLWLLMCSCFYCFSPLQFQFHMEHLSPNVIIYLNNQLTLLQTTVEWSRLCPNSNPHASHEKQNWKMEKRSTRNYPISNFELDFYSILTPETQSPHPVEHESGNKSKRSFSLSCILPVDCVHNVSLKMF